MKYYYNTNTTRYTKPNESWRCRSVQVLCAILMLEAISCFPLCSALRTNDFVRWSGSPVSYDKARHIAAPDQGTSFICKLWELLVGEKRNDSIIPPSTRGKPSSEMKISTTLSSHHERKNTPNRIQAPTTTSTNSQLIPLTQPESSGQNSIPAPTSHLRRPGRKLVSGTDANDIAIQQNSQLKSREFFAEREIKTHSEAGIPKPDIEKRQLAQAPRNQGTWFEPDPETTPPVASPKPSATATEPPQEPLNIIAPTQEPSKNKDVAEEEIARNEGSWFEDDPKSTPPVGTPAPSPSTTTTATEPPQEPSNNIIAPTQEPTSKSKEVPEEEIEQLEKEEEAEKEKEKKLEKELVREEKEVRRIGGFGVFLAVLAMVFTAHQMSENPDGIYASCCRLIITMSGCAFKMVFMPFRSAVGGNRGYGHMPVSTMDYSFRDPYRPGASEGRGMEMS